MKNNVKKITTMGILIAISVILILYGRIPFPLATFLVYEPGDVPILIGGFIFGPMSGIVLTIVAAVIQSLAFGSGGWIGCVMHIFATSTLVAVSTGIYYKKKTFKSAVIGLACGTIAMALIMIPMNLIFYPLFMGTPVKEVLKLIAPVLLPFNLIKAGINSIITIVLFRSIGKLLKNMAVM